MESQMSDEFHQLYFIFFPGYEEEKECLKIYLALKREKEK